MSIAMRRAKSRLGATAIAAVAAATIAPVAQASLTVNLSFANGTTSMSLTSASTNTDIPVYVYATVTGTGTPTAPTGTAGSTSMTPPSGTGDFDGLQYLYYNITNTGNVAGGLDAATPGVLNPTLGFNGTGPQPSPTPTAGFPAGFFGAQVGTVQNVAGGVSLGSAAAPTATTITDVAKPRSNSAVFQNYSTYNQTTGVYTTVGAGTTLNGSSIVISGNSVSFLVETLNFKPTAFTSGAMTTLAASIPTLPSPYFGANWFQDNATVTAGAQPTNTSNGTYTAGSSVTFNSSAATGGPTKGYLYGDLNGDGSVTLADFQILSSHFNTAVPVYTLGDLTGDGNVTLADFQILSSHFNTTAPSAIVADEEGQIDAIAANLGIAAPFAAVPEPATLGLFAVASAATLLRRKARVL